MQRVYTYEVPTNEWQRKQLV